MSVRGNAANFNKDKRFGTKIANTTGLIGREQQYLERLEGRMVSYPVSSDVTLWLKSDEGITLNGSRVHMWDDISPYENDINMEQSTTNYQPNYIDPSANMNNLPSVAFNGYAYSMETGNNNDLLDCTDGFTIYIVTRVINAPSSYSFLTTRTNSTSWTQGFGIMKYSSSWRFWVNNWNDGNKRVDLVFNNTTTPHIIKMHYDKVNITAEVIGTINVSGTQAFTDDVTNPSSSEGLTLCGGNSTSYVLSADIGEVIYYNRPIDGDEQTNIENYLKDRYNI